MIEIIDNSNLPKFGIKGRGAAAWLNQNGIATPEKPNASILGETLVLRLGLTEFLIEGSKAEALFELPRTDGVYPVLRQDKSIIIKGQGLHSLLLQSCAIDFSSAQTGDLFLTSMIGVGVTILFIEGGIKIWLDPTFAHYFTKELAKIAQNINQKSEEPCN